MHIAERTSDKGFIVPARTESLIPGTPFAVWHDGDRNGWVTVLADGALDLTGPSYWIVGLAETWQGWPNTREF